MNSSESSSSPKESNSEGARNRFEDPQIQIIAGGDGEQYEGLPNTDGIRKTMRNYSKLLKSCYAVRAAKTLPVGKVILAFSLGTDGKAKMVNIKNSTLGDKNIEACLISSLGKFLFPEFAPEGTTLVVQYPITFELSRK